MTELPVVGDLELGIPVVAVTTVPGMDSVATAFVVHASSVHSHEFTEDEPSGVTVATLTGVDALVEDSLD